jgi:hypothetical protein
MGAVDDFAKETVGRLGPGAYLVNVVPAAVFVLFTWALFTAHLLPWAGPLPNADPGIPSVIQSARDLTLAPVVLLAIVVALLAVLLRPFQVSAVQMLEGYWDSRFGLRALAPIALERQIRKVNAEEVWAGESHWDPSNTTFAGLAEHSRRERRRAWRRARAQRILATFPLDKSDFLPTRLGNTLQRGETTAGERYGLNTPVTYPRLYPYLSPSVSGSVVNRLDLLDTCCTFVIVFVLQALMASPLVWRADWWSLLPVTYLVFAGIAYRGARSVAERFNETLRVAYDLHRFDMLRGLHRKLPDNAGDELLENAELSEFLTQEQPLPKRTRPSWPYDHRTSGST